MKKLLYYGDTPNASTGFGNVARHVLSRLLGEYEITVFGVNEFFVKPSILPVKTISALPNNNNDPFGRKKFVEFVANSGKEFDVFFLQNDVHFWNWLPDIICPINSRGHFPHVFTYTVVDAPVRDEDLRFLGSVDVAGIPSQYGVDEILKVDPSLKYKVRHIPHGIDQKEFFPLPKETKNTFRKEVLGCDDKDFIIMNLNRNTLRKDVIRTLIYFKELQKHVPNSRLYLHMEKNEEDYKGWDLERVISTNKIRNVSMPGQFSVNQGADISILNQMYNSVNLVVSTTLGEGFGLSCVEGMATKALVMMPNNSSLSELMAGGRGIPIKCGATPGDWTILPNDTGWLRPVSDIEDMVTKTIQVVNNYPQYIVDNAYNWVTTELPWEKVINLFRAGLNDNPEITSLEGRVTL